MWTRYLLVSGSLLAGATNGISARGGRIRWPVEEGTEAGAAERRVDVSGDPASSKRTERQFGLFGLSNPFGILGHSPCQSNFDIDSGKRVGECTNENECTLSLGIPGGYCSNNQGVCCVHTNFGKCSAQTTSKFGYFNSQGWPQVNSGSTLCPHVIKPKLDTCFVRLDFLTLELEQENTKCVHDRITIMGGKEPSGNMCGDRSSEVTLVEVVPGKDITVIIQTQSTAWRWNIGITQVSCGEAAARKQELTAAASGRSGGTPCGVKNPSFNNVGKIAGGKEGSKKTNVTEETAEAATKTTANQIKAYQHSPKRLSPEEVFKNLPDISNLGEFELARLRSQVFKPSFTPQVLDYSLTDVAGLARTNAEKGRILYGNETDINEYPWQVSMWLDQSHFCGGTLVHEQWVVTAAHCVDQHYRNHFRRMTVSLGDHNVNGTHTDAKNVFRKLRRVVRFPTYDENYLHGDLALLQLDEPVEFSSRIAPACLPADQTSFGYKMGIATGWGYTERTKSLQPRPLVSDVLREVEQYILPQELCIKHSPFPITNRMVCTFKGPLGVETTCQGDSGGPLVVNNGTNQFVLVGATSFGVASCEGPYPSMFARVSSFLDFIYAAMVPAPMEYLH